MAMHACLQKSIIYLTALSKLGQISVKFFASATMFQMKICGVLIFGGKIKRAGVDVGGSLNVFRKPCILY